ncbi:uncharacterized protein NEMAJ01_2097, partial [Nematocida major]|uniref:uncharacterized protein n=1 Tax=Nematocida major TaxID=1912982 RepID=UPI002007937A
ISTFNLSGIYKVVGPPTDNRISMQIHLKNVQTYANILLLLSKMTKITANPNMITVGRSKRPNLVWKITVFRQRPGNVLERQYSVCTTRKLLNPYIEEHLKKKVENIHNYSITPSYFDVKNLLLDSKISVDYKPGQALLEIKIYVTNGEDQFTSNAVEEQSTGIGSNFSHSILFLGRKLVEQSRLYVG